MQALLSRFGLDRFPSKQESNLYVVTVPQEVLLGTVKSLLADHGFDLKTVVATDERQAGRDFVIRYIFGLPKESVLVAIEIDVDRYALSFPSLVFVSQSFSLYEQEIKSMFGLEPVGHPAPNRIILHRHYPADFYPLRKDTPWNTSFPLPTEDTITTVQGVEGEGIYQIPVGPVHAGIIEPGHFRFSALGEEIVKFEAELGYVHKGTEKLFETLPLEGTLSLAEHISGDSSIHHSLAYAQAIETLTGVEVSERAKLIRMVCAELERLANHFNDLGFIMLDTGFSFGGSHGARLRERVMQWNERVSGSRFFRGMILLGGVSRDMEEAFVDELQDDLALLEADFKEVIEIAKDSDSLLNRLKETGRLDKEIADDYGVIGVGARALGKEMDARVDYPYAAYEAVQFSVATETYGDVHARFQVRIKEVYQSFRILNQVLALLPFEISPIKVEVSALPASRMAVGIVEGWRGDIVTFVMTDAAGKIARVKVRDTSFVNWQIFSHVLLRDIVPDFPLINKSFDLSYSGNDL
ncbi:MAG: NADH-quinone oxidoreductase subunit C [Candidatus Moranbacteria bacterium]|nr:NADH-quinone oxidoreductase subunit C [Candidatus Moranbacteria bacterium]MBP6033968.1 NADH-quinone oxidoreductase subunit C [Candidatus Moranbacteria bacterium]MBP7695573.1 NADH-quinone oxidoreductase subunit C [Candidatus Moranbacteria bacterium]